MHVLFFLFVERCLLDFTSANVPQVTLSSSAYLALFSPLCLVSSVHSISLGDRNYARLRLLGLACACLGLLALACACLRSPSAGTNGETSGNKQRNKREQTGK